MRSVTVYRSVNKGLINTRLNLSFRKYIVPIKDPAWWCLSVSFIKLHLSNVT